MYYPDEDMISYVLSWWKTHSVYCIQFLWFVSFIFYATCWHLKLFYVLYWRDCFTDEASCTLIVMTPCTWPLLDYHYLINLACFFQPDDWPHLKITLWRESWWLTCCFFIRYFLVWLFVRMSELRYIQSMKSYIQSW